MVARQVHTLEAVGSSPTPATTRALRRHHAGRLKRRWLRLLRAQGYPRQYVELEATRRVSTRTPCSCWMCSYPSRPPRAALSVGVALLLAGCASPKARIDRGLTTSDEAGADIQAEATAAKAEIGMASALDLPKAAREPLKSASRRQERIASLASDVRGAVSEAREALPGVKNIGWPWWAKLGLWGGLLGSGVLIVLKLVPGLLLKWVPWASFLLPASKRATVALLRRQHDDPNEPTPSRVREAIAAARAGDRQIDALWRQG